MDTKYPGVFRAQKKDKTTYYRASVTCRGKHISLGSFSDAETAHKAYITAGELYRDSQIQIMDYTPDSPLAFEKWVCLINFRDNGIYIANPIYIRPKMFYYYYSPDIVFKFDADDLFYYSSHKIMKRGNHLFVADYGMQINIASRYGIKNHAVQGRDYNFINNDRYDFRSTNLEIYNIYHGVFTHVKNGITRYRARIHINGNLILGTYNTREEAAVAYNKAADFLMQNGCSVQYQKNYLESLPKEEYLKLYEKVKITHKLSSYLTE